MRVVCFGVYNDLDDIIDFCLFIDFLKNFLRYIYLIYIIPWSYQEREKYRNNKLIKRHVNIK